MQDDLFLAIMGFLTGLVDAIVGGGGLISVPSYMLILGPTADAIATNKVTAFVSTLTALSIYYRRGYVKVQDYKPFFLFVFVGAILGAQSSQFVPPVFYKLMMLFLIPILLFVLFKKQLWVEKIQNAKPPSHALLLSLGLLCGFYDGVAGPGGGTFMFLLLFIVAGMPLSLSIGTAKLANVFSSSSSLVTYVYLGKVHWAVAVPGTVTIILGAALGARSATTNAAFVARLALGIVSTLLVIRLIFYT